MKHVETIHKLSDSEKELLKSFIGKKLTNIYSNGLELAFKGDFFQFPSSINLSLGHPKEGYCIFEYSFDETNFGNDFHYLSIKNSIEPSGLKASEWQGKPYGLVWPFVDIRFDEYIINKVEVYGHEYSMMSENNDPKTIWVVEKQNPGVPITETVSSENIIVLSSTANEKIQIYGFGPAPWTVVKAVSVGEDEKIENVIGELSYAERQFTKLKLTIE